ncbi:hypothetical protein ET495_13425 [Xylanimonas allomyrinae]|uniref:Uncharacterized protein n=1 Tax=Xylanimonas allomyrinae TaxID=2509459 RepID=A0A4P6EMZ7_9MICO|nr:hypothetical protein [Xylanimonas allomyrinae]QAY64054.1 hypothetical protein ET495_13425 [Xylanimonas allomyrinae]
MTAHQDEQLAARLRRATAQAPASALDLDDVLHAARGKARRARAVTGVGVALALGLTGIGVAEVGPRLVSPSSEPAGRSAATGERLCPDGTALDVSFGEVGEPQPWVSRVQRMEVAADGRPGAWADVRPDDGSPWVHVLARTAPGWYRTVVLNRARELRHPLIPDGVRTLRGRAVIAPDDPATLVHSGSDPVVRSGSAPAAFDPRPGDVFLAYTAAQRATVDGAVGCRPESEPFVLTSTTVEEFDVVVRCAPQTEGLTGVGVVVAMALCPPDRLPEQARRHLESLLSGPQGEAARNEAIRMLGLPADG